MSLLTPILIKDGLRVGYDRYSKVDRAFLRDMALPVPRGNSHSLTDKSFVRVIKPPSHTISADESSVTRPIVFMGQLLSMREQQPVCRHSWPLVIIERLRLSLLY